MCHGSHMPGFLCQSGAGNIPGQETVLEASLGQSRSRAC